MSDNLASPTATTPTADLETLADAAASATTFWEWREWFKTFAAFVDSCDVCEIDSGSLARILDLCQTAERQAQRCGFTRFTKTQALRTIQTFRQECGGATEVPGTADAHHEENGKNDRQERRTEEAYVDLRAFVAPRPLFKVPAMVETTSESPREPDTGSPEVDELDGGGSRLEDAGGTQATGSADENGGPAGPLPVMDADEFRARYTGDDEGLKEAGKRQPAANKCHACRKAVAKSLCVLDSACLGATSKEGWKDKCLRCKRSRIVCNFRQIEVPHETKELVLPPFPPKKQGRAKLSGQEAAELTPLRNDSNIPVPVSNVAAVPTAPAPVPIQEYKEHYNTEDISLMQAGRMQDVITKPGKYDKEPLKFASTKTKADKTDTVVVKQKKRTIEVIDSDIMDRHGSNRQNLNAAPSAASKSLAIEEEPFWEKTGVPKLLILRRFEQFLADVQKRASDSAESEHGQVRWDEREGARDNEDNSNAIESEEDEPEEERRLVKRRRRR